MSEPSDFGVLYTEHSALKSGTPLASLWSYQICQRSPNRPAVVRRHDGRQEYWLDRSDPLLNTTQSTRSRSENRTREPEVLALTEGVSVDEMAKCHGLTRQRFARRFNAVVGLSPKLFARITRFQALVHALLSTQVSRWSSVAPAIGFYDQAHMINEFRTFAGAPPTVFFQPHGHIAEPGVVRLRGRPSEWLDRDDSESRLARQT